MDYFDYETAAQEAGLTAGQLEQLVQVVRRDYPSDTMLFELHVFRACRAIRDGVATLEQVLTESAEASPGRKA